MEHLREQWRKTAHLSALTGRRLWWRIHPSDRPFMPETAHSTPIWNTFNEPGVQGFSAVGNPWHLWAYAASMGWLSNSGPSKAWNDDVIGFTGTMMEGNWNDRGWQADGRRDKSGSDGEPLVMPDMKIIERYTWGEFERELLDTPFPRGPLNGRAYEGEDAIRNGRWNWEAFAKDLLDGKKSGLWKDSDHAAKVANFVIEKWLGKGELARTASSADVVFDSVSDDPGRWDSYSRSWPERKKKMTNRTKRVGEFTMYLQDYGDDREIFVTLGDRVVADAYFGYVGTELKAAVQVDPKYRRRGIATAMYSWVEEIAGDKLTPDRPHTPYAEALWNQPNRPFGQMGGS